MYLYENKNYYLRLKLIHECDIEDLRVWKNKSKQYFFLKQDISPKQQRKWFESYQLNKENFMFVVQEFYDGSFINIGSMGYRDINGEIDVYNIMRGRKVHNSKNTMANAFTLMNNYIFDTCKLDITCKVLKENPANSWYEKVGFEKVKEVKDYWKYKLNTTNFRKLNIRKEYE